METVIFQDWTTVSGTGPTPFVQDPAEWISGSGYSDWTFWLDCSFVTPSSSVSLIYETAPSRDDASFQNAGTVNPIAASTAPVVTRALLSRTTLAPPASWLRWKLQGPAAGTWSMTFRILASRGRAGGGTFEPRQLPGCAVWLRSDIGITLVSGAVSRWADQSGNGNDATQGSSGRRPAFDVARINGRPTLFFDPSVAGSEKIMALTSSLSALSASHAFVVFKLVTASPSVPIWTGLWKLGTSGQVTHVPFTDTNIYDDGGGNVRYACGPPLVSLAPAVVYEHLAESNQRNATIPQRREHARVDGDPRARRPFERQCLPQRVHGRILPLRPSSLDRREDSGGRLPQRVVQLGERVIGRAMRGCS
jgi:hypothetical protein